MTTVHTNRKAAENLLSANTPVAKGSIESIEQHVAIVTALARRHGITVEAAVGAMPAFWDWPYTKTPVRESQIFSTVSIALCHLRASHRVSTFCIVNTVAAYVGYATPYDALHHTNPVAIVCSTNNNNFPTEVVIHYY